MKLVLLLTLLTLTLCQVPDYNEVCVHNPDTYNTNQSSILLFFNGCLRVSQENQVIVNLSKFIIEWLEPTKYCQLLFILLFSLPYLYDAFNQSSEKNLMARYGHYILEISLFLFRISFVYSIQTWLNCIFRQSTPCLCQTGTDIRFLPITDVPWGMPSGFIMTSCILGLHFIERIDIVIGILIILGNTFAQVFIGYNSSGQVITGLVFGILLHFYLTRTPLFMRFLDIILNLLLGIPIFLIVGHFYKNTDFTFVTIYFKGLIWQIFSLTPLFTFFSFKFVQEIIKKRSYSVNVEDFQFGGLGLVPDEKEAESHIFTKLFNSKLFMNLFILSFFIFQVIIQISSRYMNDMFHV